MGIKYFTGFVNRHSATLFRKVQFTDLKSIVIDGNGLCHQLYHQKNCDWKLGGEYPEFYSKVKHFFEQILHAGVKPVVIFDGSHDQRKMETVLRRKEEKNIEILKSQESGCWSRASVSPILMLQTFINVIKDLKVKLYVAACEADKEVAAVANSLRCPVLSTDSDYFMFELRHGYIPFDKFSITTCYLFHIDYFVAQFCLQDPKFRLFIPAIHGNDFLCASRSSDFEGTIQMISAYSSYETCLTTECSTLELQNFIAAEKQYCNPEILPEEDMKASFILSYRLPEWTFDNFRTGCFHPHLLDIKKNNFRTLGNVVEDIRRESAWLCSRFIRQNLYGFLGISAQVNENIRRKALPQMVKENVSPKNVSPPLNLRDFQTGRGKELVLYILNCCSIPTDTFEELEEKWKLPIATLVYWFRKSHIVTEHLLKSLLLCFLNCSGILSHVDSFSIPEQRANLCDLHAFAQWQCIYYDAMVLNYVVREPFITTCPSLLFSGKIAMFYASCSKKYLDSKISKESIFHLMFKLVTCSRDLKVSYDRSCLQVTKCASKPSHQ